MSKIKLIDNEKHIILCGFGHVGYRCFHLLAKLGVSLAVVCDKVQADWLRELESCGVLVFIGDARDTNLLKKAGIARAAAVLVVTDQDLVNIAVAIDARVLNPEVRLVVRLFDQLLAAHLQELLGIDHVFSTSALAGPVFAAAALGKSILGATQIGKHSYSLVLDDFSVLTRTLIDDDFHYLFAQGNDGKWRPFSAQPVDPRNKVIAIQKIKAKKSVASPLKGPEELDFRAVYQHFLSIPWEIRFVFNSLLIILLFSIGVFHFQMGLSFLDSLYFTVTVFTSTGFGDISFLNSPALVKLYGVFAMLCGTALLAATVGIVQDFLLSHRLREVLHRRDLPHSGHNILVGFGAIGFRISQILRDAGEDYAIIDSGTEDKFLNSQRADISVIHGDARDKDVLLKANIETAKSIILLTDDQLVNLGVGLLARSINPQIQTVVRTFDAALGEKLQASFALDSVLSISAVSAPVFVASAIFPAVVEAFVCQDALLLLMSDPDGKEDLTHPAVQTVNIFVNEATGKILNAPDTDPQDAEVTRLAACLVPFASIKKE